MAFKPTLFTRSLESPRYVFINNFSAAGRNTALQLEDAPIKAALKPDCRSGHVITVTAKSLSSFKQNVKRLLSWAKDQSDAALPSLAYTITARRSHYQYCLTFEAKTMQQVRDTLNTHADAARQPISSNKTPKVAFSFTGQGSHYIGMGKQLFKGVAKFRRDLEDYDQIATTHSFPLFMGLIDGIITELAEVSPVVTQLAIACTEMALTRLQKSWGIMPSVVIGHSLGEYAALNIAGLLSALDTILLVGRRAELLVANCAVGSHGMLAVRASLAAIEPLISHIQVERACTNAPEELVFSGTVDNISLLRETLVSNSFKATQLNFLYAFYSAQVEAILEEFKAAAKSAVFHAPQILVISTYTGCIVEDASVFGPEYLARHCRDSASFLRSVTSAIQSGVIEERGGRYWVDYLIQLNPQCQRIHTSRQVKQHV